MSFLDTKKVPLVLVYRDIAGLPDVPHCDIMLSPQFYVIKREDLPLKYAFQAKKLAPSILDELTGEGTFTYEAFQEEDAWVFVAYDLQALAAFLEGKGRSIEQVRRIYFAEQAKKKFVPPVELNDRDVLTLVNDTVTVVPKHLLENREHFSLFGEEFRPKKHFSFKHTHHSFLDTKLTIILVSLLVLLGITYLAEGYRYHQAVSGAESRLNALLDANPSLRGVYARKSIHKKYLSINTAQRQIRDRIQNVSRLTGKKTKINAFLVDNKGYRVTLDIPRDSKTVTSLKALADSENLEHVKVSADKFEAWGTFQ